jgi:hypothetical protein
MGFDTGLIRWGLELGPELDSAGIILGLCILNAAGLILHFAGLYIVIRVELGQPVLIVVSAIVLGYDSLKSAILILHEPHIISRTTDVVPTYDNIGGLLPFIPLIAIQMGGLIMGLDHGLSKDNTFPVITPAQGPDQGFLVRDCGFESIVM